MVPVETHKLALVHHRVSSSTVVRASDYSRSRRVVDSNPIWNSDFLPSSPCFQYHVAVSSLIYPLWSLVGCILICFNVFSCSKVLCPLMNIIDICQCNLYKTLLTGAIKFVVVAVVGKKTASLFGQKNVVENHTQLRYS